MCLCVSLCTYANYVYMGLKKLDCRPCDYCEASYLLHLIFYCHSSTCQIRGKHTLLQMLISLFSFSRTFLHAMHLVVLLHIAIFFLICDRSQSCLPIRQSAYKYLYCQCEHEHNRQRTKTNAHSIYYDNDFLDFTTLFIVM